MSGIFITYRSEDPGWSVVLDRELSAVFGSDQVFRASRTMKLGESFPERIRAGVENAQVLLAVVGPRWLEVRSDGRRRIDDPDDWVRREIRIALQSGILVVPVLVDGVNPLTADQLPDDIRSLGERQYIRLSHSDVERDVRRLIERLGQQVPNLHPAQPYYPAEPPPAPSRASNQAPAAHLPLGSAPHILVVAGLALLLLAVLLPWTHDNRAIGFSWDEWTFAIILPEGALALVALAAATGLLTSRFEAAAMGVVGAAGFLAVDIAAWGVNHLKVVKDLPNLQIGVLLYFLGGIVLLVATGIWAHSQRGVSPRHSNRTVATAVGFAVFLVAQWFQGNADEFWFTAGHGLALLAIVLALLIPGSIPTPVRTAALSGFTLLALATTLAVVNYLTRFEDATLDDPPGRGLLSIGVAAGIWIALGRTPARP